jgi:hypothetical protein
MGYRCYQLHTKFYPLFFSRLSPYMKLLGIVNMLQINYSSDLLHSLDTGEKMGAQRDSTSATDFKKAYDSVRREVLYNILIVCGTHETH